METSENELIMIPLNSLLVMGTVKGPLLMDLCQVIQAAGQDASGQMKVIYQPIKIGTGVIDWSRQPCLIKIDRGSVLGMAYIQTVTGIRVQSGIGGHV